MDGSDKLLRKLANEQMGPVLEAMGVTEDPFDFFVDLLKVMTMLTMMLAMHVWNDVGDGSVTFIVKIGGMEENPPTRGSC